MKFVYRLRKVGGHSYGITIPLSFVEMNDLKVGDYIEVEILEVAKRSKELKDTKLKDNKFNVS